VVREAAEAWAPAKRETAALEGWAVGWVGWATAAAGRAMAAL